MSEQLRGNHERLAETVDAGAEAEENLNRLHKAAEKAEQDPLNKQVESLRRRVEQQAVSGKELAPGSEHSETHQQSFGITRSLKNDAYRKTLRHVQGNLNVPERVISKVVHQPAIEAVSNALSKSVARPSAFLGGSFMALVGSAILLYMARQYGFTYNYAVLFMLFIGGFLLGLLLELLMRVLVRRR